MVSLPNTILLLCPLGRGTLGRRAFLIVFLPPSEHRPGAARLRPGGTWRAWAFRCAVGGRERPAFGVARKPAS